MLSFTNTTTATATATVTTMQSASVKTFKANVCEQTLQGKMVVGTVLVTIDQGVVDFSKLSDRVTLEQLIEVDGVPTFNLFDFPDTADLPAIDIQVAEPPIELPVAEHVFDFPLFNYTDTHLSEGE